MKSGHTTSLTPVVSVLMPVYNEEAFLNQAIKSILNQTFSSFELIVIDDGSTDKTAAIIKSYNDPRIVYLKNSNNQGIGYSENLGLNKCRGKYVAPMDGDDISLPQRLEKQIQFLENHPGVGIISAAARVIDKNGKIINIFHPCQSDGAIHWQSLSENPFCHSATMIRRRILVENNLHYSERKDFSYIEDYELWLRLLPVTKAANLAEPLIYYRWSDKKNRPTDLARRQAFQHRQFTSDNIKNYFPYLTFTQKQINGLCAARRHTDGEKFSLADLTATYQFIKQLRLAFLQSKPLTPFERQEINQDVGKILHQLALMVRPLSLKKSLAIVLAATKLSPAVLSLIGQDFKLLLIRVFKKLIYNKLPKQ